MLMAVQEISNLIEPVASAARAEASQLGHKVTGLWGEGGSRGPWKEAPLTTWAEEGHHAEQSGGFLGGKGLDGPCCCCLWKV